MPVSKTRQGKTPLILGIDPGKNGCLVGLTRSGQVSLLYKFAGMEIADWAKLITGLRGSTAFLEHVQSSPQMGVVSAFTFGKGYGSLIAGLLCADISFHSVYPRTWRTALGIKKVGGGFGANDKEKKRLTREKAQEVFPKVKVTAWNSDGLLIAEYGRRKIESGEVQF